MGVGVSVCLRMGSIGPILFWSIGFCYTYKASKFLYNALTSLRVCLERLTLYSGTDVVLLTRQVHTSVIRAQWLRSRALDSLLRGPGLESCAAVLKPWTNVVYSTLLQFTQLYK